MYNLGKMFGYVHLYIGEEAVAAGFIKLLTQRDAVVSTYRDHVHALCKGVSPRPMMAELFGWTTGLCRGQGGSMHMFYRPCNFLGGFGFIGEGIPIATGAALMPSIAVRYSRNRAPRTSTWPSSSLAMGPATSASSSSA